MNPEWLRDEGTVEGSGRILNLSFSRVASVTMFVPVRAVHRREVGMERMG